MLEQPYYLSELRAAQILRERSWSHQERLDELKSELVASSRYPFCVFGHMRPIPWLTLGVLVPSSSDHYRGSPPTCHQPFVKELYRGIGPWKHRQGRTSPCSI